MSIKAIQDNRESINNSASQLARQQWIKKYPDDYQYPAERIELATQHAFLKTFGWWQEQEYWMHEQGSNNFYPTAKECKEQLYQLYSDIKGILEHGEDYVAKGDSLKKLIKQLSQEKEVK